MSTLAFFPWVTLPAPVVLGKYRLVPHRVGASLEPEPRVIDALLSAFQEPVGRPVESAVLVHLHARALTADLPPEERAGLHLLADAVIFGALARRRFFDDRTSGGGAQLDFVLRQFTGNDPRALLVSVRRREGARWVAHEDPTRMARPVPARHRAGLEADWSLVGSLLDAFAAPRGAELRDAIAAFITGSDDRGTTAVAHELLWLITAFERLLGGPGEGELPGRLVSLLDPFVARARAPRRLVTLRRLEATVEGGREPSASILQAWARDLLRARVECSVGRRGAAYWSPEAHLLVGAQVFPAAVLARLAAGGLRPLAEADRKTLLACPYLASLRDPFARRRSLALNDRYLWRVALLVAGRQMAQIQLEDVVARAGRGVRNPVR
jgi:hypothetical protein